MTILLIGRALFMADIWDELVRAGKPAVCLARSFCLDQALEALRSHYDGVICQQSFPTHLDRGSSFEPPETQANNWAHVSAACREMRIPLVLVVNSERIFDQFNAMAQREMAVWPAFAFLDPVDPRTAAETLCGAIRIFAAQARALDSGCSAGVPTGEGTRVETPALQAACTAEVEKVR